MIILSGRNGMFIRINYESDPNENKLRSERNVQRQQVFEDSGFRPAVIFEIDDPLHRRVIGITNDLAAHLQAGSGIGISPHLPFAGGIRRTGFHFQFAAA